MATRITHAEPNSAIIQVRLLNGGTWENILRDDNDDERRADFHEVLQEYETRKKFLDDVESYTGQRYSRPYLSKVLSGKLYIPSAMTRWTNVKLATGGNSMTIEMGASRRLKLLVELLERGDADILIDWADALIRLAAYEPFRDEKPSFVVLLWFLQASGFRLQAIRACRGKDPDSRALDIAIGYTERAALCHQRAAEYARKSAPELELGNVISALVYRSQAAQDRFKRLQNTTTLQRDAVLLKVIAELLRLPADHSRLIVENLRLKLLMRNASRMGDCQRELFTTSLKQARMHPSFGDTPEARDKTLRTWMSTRNDKDGDFERARHWLSIGNSFPVK